MRPVYEPITKGVLAGALLGGRRQYRCGVLPQRDSAGLAGLGVQHRLAGLGVQHRLAGHSNSLDDLGLGLAFVIVSLVVLAGTLVAPPLLANRLGSD